MVGRTILRLQEIAERTGIPIATLRWYRHKDGERNGAPWTGLGPPTWRLARRVVAYEDEVDSWLEQQAQAAS